MDVSIGTDDTLGSCDLKAQCLTFKTCQQRGFVNDADIIVLLQYRKWLPPHSKDHRIRLKLTRYLIRSEFIWSSLEPDRQSRTNDGEIIVVDGDLRIGSRLPLRGRRSNEQNQA